MGKTPVRMKAVIYALSPFQQKVMPGLWKDLPGKIHHKVSENWLNATLLLAPLVGTYRSVDVRQQFTTRKHVKVLDDMNISRDTEYWEQSLSVNPSGSYVQYYKENEKLEHRY